MCRASASSPPAVLNPSPHRYPRFPHRLLVDDAELHPQHLGADVDRVAGERRNVPGGTEAVDHVHRLGDVLQGRVAGLAEHLLVPGIDRNDPVAVVEEVLRGEVARPVPARREADHRDDAVLGEDSAQGGDVVVQRGNSRSMSIGGGENSTGPEASRAGAGGGVFLQIRGSI